MRARQYRSLVEFQQKGVSAVRTRRGRVFLEYFQKEQRAGPVGACVPCWPRSASGGNGQMPLVFRCQQLGLARNAFPSSF